MTFEECCGVKGLATVSWSPHDISSDIFYWNFLSKGASMCQRCHKNCSSLVCEQGKACRMVNGLPICICKPQCDKTLKSRGALCGTDGQKYRHYCALQRYNCVAERQISVEYFGKCRNSCKRVECETGKHCLQDQNGAPHCIPCHEHCDSITPNNPEDYMCGENGKTYRSTCELKADICKTGRSIRISHSGKCTAHENCKTLACPRGTTCLVSAVSGKPVCMNCYRNASCLHTNVPICGTDKKTYSSYCRMLKSGCRSGVFVSTLRRGPCRRHQKRKKLSKGKLNTFETNKRNVKKRIRRRHRRHKRNRRHRRKSKRRKQKKKEKNHNTVSYKTNTLYDKRKNRHFGRREGFEVTRTAS
ncbi:follistatin-like isoform X2 [Mercenaria mercenaria]|nr:follistatin-like isoform X2 [Mercenaria mercenaria]